MNIKKRENGEKKGSQFNEGDVAFDDPSGVFNMFIGKIDDLVAVNDQLIKEKDKQLSEKDKQLSEKDKQLSEKDKQLSEKDKEIYSLKKFVKTFLGRFFDYNKLLAKELCDSKEELEYLAKLAFHVRNTQFFAICGLFGIKRNENIKSDLTPNFIIKKDVASSFEYDAKKSEDKNSKDFVNEILSNIGINAECVGKKRIIYLKDFEEKLKEHTNERCESFKRKSNELWESALINDKGLDNFAKDIYESIMKSVKDSIIFGTKITGNIPPNFEPQKKYLMDNISVLDDKREERICVIECKEMIVSSKKLSDAIFQLHVYSAFLYNELEEKAQKSGHKLELYGIVYNFDTIFICKYVKTDENSKFPDYNIVYENKNQGKFSVKIITSYLRAILTFMGKFGFSINEELREKTNNWEKI